MVGPLLPVMWSYCRYNCIKSKSIYLKSLTIQLISTLIWKFQFEFIKLLASENNLQLALTTISKNQHLLEEKHERKRVIIGLTSLLLIGDKPQTIFDSLPLLFKVLVKLVRKNAKSRVLTYLYENRNSN